MKKKKHECKGLTRIIWEERKFVNEELFHLKESRTSQLAQKADKVMGDYLNQKQEEKIQQVLRNT